MKLRWQTQSKRASLPVRRSMYLKVNHRQQTIREAFPHALDLMQVAVQAGREIRIIVDPGTVPDDQTLLLARDVARKIEQEMTYPGQIKVTVIRESRATEVAR